jgi:uncharacterized protein
LSIVGLEERTEALRTILRRMGKVAIAYSGGADSTLLLAMAMESAEPIAVLCDSEIFSPCQRDDAVRTAWSLGAPLRIVRCDHLSLPGFVKNDEERCYHCKRLMYSEVIRVAEEERYRTVADGELIDDVGRPGSRAARELGVRSPLAEAGLGKEDVLILLDRMGIDIPAKDTCAATRIPFGERLERRRLRLVIQAEEVVRGFGIDHVRVRLHGDHARIEVLSEDMDTVLRHREELVSDLRALGLVHVSLDLRGYRYGSMSERSHGRSSESDPGDQG